MAHPSFRLLDAYASSPALRILDTFSIPFAVFARDGRRTYTSEGAEALLQATIGAELLWEQVSRLVTAGAHLDAAGGGIAATLPTAAGCLLALRALPDGSEHAAAVAILQPGVPGGAWPNRRVGALTDRESHVARLIALGFSNKEVAGRLGISVHTARRHTESVYRKLGISGRARLAGLLAADADTAHAGAVA